MKRYRDESGKLNMSVSEVAKLTAAEANEYYQIGGIYLYNADHDEYVLTEKDDDIALFHSFSGRQIFISVDSLGTFLPDIASEGMELIRVE